MEKPKKFLIMSLEGVLGAACAVNCIEQISIYTNTQAAVLQAELAKSPVLTEQVRQSVKETVDNVSNGNYYMALANGVMAGWMVAMLAYDIFND